MTDKLLIFSDGGARGNPGPSAIAYIALNQKGTFLGSNSRFIGVHTNNQAEYEALILALEYALKIQAQEVICHLDSELVVKQLNGEYSVRNQELRILFDRVQKITKYFIRISFVNVPRGNIHIQNADKLVNKTLDEQAKNF